MRCMCVNALRQAQVLYTCVLPCAREPTLHALKGNSRGHKHTSVNMKTVCAKPVDMALLRV